MIYALHHEQNIWNMRGLLKKMPITGMTFLIGTLALCGIFPLSGFWSKDTILALAFENNTVLYLIAATGQWINSFLYGTIMVGGFLGEAPVGYPRVDKLKPTNPLAGMTLPLIFLAILSAIGGFIGIPHYLFPQQNTGRIEYEGCCHFFCYCHFRPWLLLYDLW